MAQVRVTLEDTVRERRLKLKLPDDVPLEQLVPALVRKMGLPKGKYVLVVEATDVTLGPDVTLAGVGIFEGATLRLERAVLEVPPAKPVPPPPAVPAPVRSKRPAISLLLAIVIGWIIAGIIAWNEIFSPGTILWGISGAIGGFVTGLALRSTEPSIRWKEILIVIIGWGCAWASAWAVIMGFSVAMSLIVAPIMGGVIGGGVMFWQLGRARRRA
jgi:hypothetical protein